VTAAEADLIAEAIERRLGPRFKAIENRLSSLRAGMGEGFGTIAERVEKTASNSDHRHSIVSGKLSGIGRSIESMERRMTSYEATLHRMGDQVTGTHKSAQRIDDRLGVMEKRQASKA